MLCIVVGATTTTSVLSRGFCGIDRDLGEEEGDGGGCFGSGCFNFAGRSSRGRPEILSVHALLILTFPWHPAPSPSINVTAFLHCAHLTSNWTLAISPSSMMNDFANSTRHDTDCDSLHLNHDLISILTRPPPRPQRHPPSSRPRTQPQKKLASVISYPTSTLHPIALPCHR